MRETAFLTKLEIFGQLRKDDKALLAHACRDVHKFRARDHIIREGDRPEQVHVILDGWAARYMTLSNGARQIIAFLLPGDFCDLHTAVLGKMDHSIVAVSPCRVAFVRNAELNELTNNHNGLTKALWWSTLVDEAVLRSWVLNIGRRHAYERIAHLLCELHCRLSLIGLVNADTFDLPITQEELADATGMTPIHTNRTLQKLRSEGLIVLENRQLRVPDVKALQRVAGFDAGYLHIEQRNKLNPQPAAP